MSEVIEIHVERPVSAEDACVEMTGAKRLRAGFIPYCLGLLCVPQCGPEYTGMPDITLGCRIADRLSRTLFQRRVGHWIGRELGPDRGIIWGKGRRHRLMKGTSADMLLTRNVNRKRSRSVAEILRMGSIGPAVRVLQHRLNRAIRLPSIKEDGIFGRLTEARTKAFQQKYGLRPDGIAGPATQATLAANFVPDDAKAKRAIVAAAWHHVMHKS